MFKYRMTKQIPISSNDKIPFLGIRHSGIGHSFGDSDFVIQIFEA